jgi:hypothetical protein
MRKFMTRHIYIILTVFLTACGTTSADKNQADVDSTKIDKTTSLQTNVGTYNSVAQDTTDNNNATYFVVVADTSSDWQTDRNDYLRWTCITISTVFQNRTWQTNVEHSISQLVTLLTKGLMKLTNKTEQI